MRSQLERLLPISLRFQAKFGLIAVAILLLKPETSICSQTSEIVSPEQVVVEDWPEFGNRAQLASDYQSRSSQIGIAQQSGEPNKSKYIQDITSSSDLDRLFKNLLEPYDGNSHMNIGPKSRRERGKYFKLVNYARRIIRHSKTFQDTPTSKAQNELQVKLDSISRRKRFTLESEEDSKVPTNLGFSRRSEAEDFPDPNEKRLSGMNSRSNGDESSNKRGFLRSPNRAVINRWAKKTDWNTLFVKLAKVFLQYFLDLVLNDVFGTTGTRRSFDSSESDTKKTLFRILRFANELRKSK